MEKFKDFLYNKNDIVVALVILIIALIIIGFRVAAIMEYPKTLAAEQAAQVQSIEEDESTSTTTESTDE